MRGRAEETARSSQFRQQFDLVVSRSFGVPAVAAECGAPLLSIGGFMVVSEPPDGPLVDRWPAEGLAKVGLQAGDPLRFDDRFGYQVLGQIASDRRTIPEASGHTGQTTTVLTHADWDRSLFHGERGQRSGSRGDGEIRCCPTRREGSGSGSRAGVEPRPGSVPGQGDPTDRNHVPGSEGSAHRPKGARVNSPFHVEHGQRGGSPWQRVSSGVVEHGRAGIGSPCHGGWASLEGSSWERSKGPLVRARWHRVSRPVLEDPGSSRIAIRARRGGRDQAFSRRVMRAGFGHPQIPALPRSREDPQVHVREETAGSQRDGGSKWCSAGVVTVGNQAHCRPDAANSRVGRRGLPSVVGQGGSRRRFSDGPAEGRAGVGGWVRPYDHMFPPAGSCRRVDPEPRRSSLVTVGKAEMESQLGVGGSPARPGWLARSLLQKGHPWVRVSRGTFPIEKA